MRKPKRPWTAAEVARLLQMRDVEKRKWTEIDEALGRTHASSAAKYELLRAEPAMRGMHENGSRLVIPARLEVERAARKEAELQRNLTQETFGDPPPGFSALDRRKSEVAR